MILAIDPGKEKCGAAVLSKDGQVQERTIVPAAEIINAVLRYIAKFGVSTLVVGRSAFGKDLEKSLSRLDLRANIVFVSEKFSTLEARRRYWQENQPRGILRLIPTSLLHPPRPVDDYAAVILGERYLKG